MLFFHRSLNFFKAVKERTKNAFGAIEKARNFLSGSETI